MLQQPHEKHLLPPPEETYFDESPLTSSDLDYTRACYTPLPDENTEEVSLFEPMGNIEEESYQSADTADVTNGITLTEEAVEFGAANMVARIILDIDESVSTKAGAC